VHIAKRCTVASFLNLCKHKRHVFLRICALQYHFQVPVVHVAERCTVASFLNFCKLKWLECMITGSLRQINMEGNVINKKNYIRK
jgi:hypothetical protein